MKPLAHFKKGGKVKIACYGQYCKGILLPVILGEEYKIDPSFIRGGGVGRIHWRPKAVAKGFNLGRNLGGSGYCNCPGCKTLFGGVIIIFNGRGKKPFIFGYDPEPA